MKQPSSYHAESVSGRRGPDFVKRLSKHAALENDVLEPATDAAWDRLQRMLGTKFPSPHKRLLKTFGTGVFGGRLLLLNPSAEQDWRSEYSARWAHGVTSLLRGGFPKLNWELEEGGLLPFGMTMDGAYLCFDREAGPSWSIRVCSIRDHWTRRSNLSSAEFLCQLATGEGRLKSELRLKLWRPGELIFRPTPYLTCR